MRRWTVDFFFPLRCFETAVLEKGVGDHRHERMTVKTLPGSSFEVIKAKFFFHLLVRLLAYPSRLDGGRQGAQVGRRRQVGEIVFFLSRHPAFADEPSLVSRQMDPPGAHGAGARPLDEEVIGPQESHLIWYHLS